MARDATARLYDVDQETFQYKRLRLTEKYDQATIAFRAKPGKLIDLDKLHESIWATRLSGGTNSGAICLEVTAMGDVEMTDRETVLKIQGAERQFVLVSDVKAKPTGAKPGVLSALRDSLANGEQVVSVTGYVEGWTGRWPTVLSQPPAKRPTLMVTSFEKAKAE